MKRRRRSRSVLAVSLFPFLAVLICTLGVLIVLLVLAVKAADSQAAAVQADVDSASQQQLNQVQLELEGRELQIEGLKSVRPEALQRLEEARSTRSHFEAELRSLQREAQSLAETLLVIENQRRGIQTNDVSDEELAALKLEIEAAKKQRDEKREQVQQAPEAVWSIVPYAGNSGTNRRPIFVECLADKLVIQPLGVSIARKDLAAGVPGNTLDAALLTIREYWQRYDLDGENGRAYPLIIVRPEGTRTFQTVKQSLKQWDDEFGYELVDGDKKLAFGNPDPQLTGEVLAAIEEAKVRQERLIAIARQRQQQARRISRNRRPKSERRPGLTVSGTQGGFVFNGAQQGTETGSNTGLGSGSTGAHHSNVGYSGYQGGGSASGNDSPNSGWSGEFAADAQTGGVQTGEETGGPQLAGGTGESQTAGGMGEGRAAGDISGTQAAGGTAATGSSSATSGNGSQFSQESSQGSSAESSAEGSSNQTNAPPTQSLAAERGSGWALPSRSAGAVPYVRPIRVVCYSDRLVIKGVRGDQAIPFTHATTADVDGFVNQIWSQIESWGVAGANSYWKPQLRITVMPGSHDHFKTLRRLLADSGILVEGA